MKDCLLRCATQWSLTTFAVVRPPLRCVNFGRSASTFSAVGLPSPTVETDIKRSALGDLIRRHLALTGETQGAFARRAGVSEGAVSGYLSGRQATSWFQEGHLEKLARALGVSPDEIALARVEDLGYHVTERSFSPQETLVLAMLRDADEAERERVIRIIRAVLGD